MYSMEVYEFIMSIIYQYQEFLMNRTSFANATQHYIYMFDYTIDIINRIAPTVNLEMKSKIEGGTIFICTQTASLNGILSSDGDVASNELD